jgi:hypothetical protein
MVNNKYRNNMAQKNTEIDDLLKITLGFDKKTPTIEIEKKLKGCIKRYCKPCWELHYCPYGPLIEDFPLLPHVIEKEIEYNHFIDCIYNKKLPKYITEMSCIRFGHICPVFSCGEPITKSKQIINNSRIIPRDILIKTIRRDNQRCQICNEYVSEDEIELDHIIPISKGGKTTIENLRVLCRSCNKAKSN